MKDSRVAFFVVNTAPRGRSIHQTGVLYRLVGGTLQFLRDWLLFVFTLIRNRPDVIHLTTSGHLAVMRDLAVILTGLLFFKKTIYHIRFGRIPDISATKTWEWRFFRRAANLAACIVAIDRKTFHTLHDALPGKTVRLISNCIEPANLPDTNRPKPQRNELVVIFLGWAIRAKGLDELIQAWTTLDNPHASLEIYGPFEEKYKSKLWEMYHPLNVHFHGNTEHPIVMNALRDADVFVLPSHTEGFPNVVLEAMMLETPVIATEVGAIPEMLADERGLLIPPKNVPALVDALTCFMRDEKLRTRYAANAKAYAMEHYTIESVFQQLFQIWTQYSPSQVRQ
jgi:glycosyltransferase involved in cell wall biosynthesis